MRSSSASFDSPFAGIHSEVRIADPPGAASLLSHDLLAKEYHGTGWLRMKKPS
jgi:hypothetical protein